MSKQFYFEQFGLSLVRWLNAKISIVKEARFSSIQHIDMTLIRYYHCGPEWTWEWLQWRGTPHSPKPQHCWNLTIWLFSVISMTLVGGVLPFCREAVSVFYWVKFRISTQFSSIWPIDRALSGATTLGQSGPGSDGNKGVLCISHSSSITGTSPSDCLVSNLGYSLGRFYSSAEMQFVYSTAPAQRAMSVLVHVNKCTSDR